MTELNAEMADEVPVCEVLCHAMEYLSKLGSNLRTRSEVLKEKKINKNKLKNTHAVQKAANKVLLICELSKKSIENVESGIKKVLKHVDESQASTADGGKTSRRDKHSSYNKKSSHYQHSSPDKHSSRDNHFSRDKSSEIKNYQSFEYNSQILRVSRKVSVSHYMSAKVLLKTLPESIMDKYPVYYNCKLYRLRKKKVIGKIQKAKRSVKLSKKDDSVDLTLKSSEEEEENVEHVDKDLLAFKLIEKRDGSDSEKSNTDSKSLNNEVEEIVLKIKETKDESDSEGAFKTKGIKIDTNSSKNDKKEVETKVKQNSLSEDSSGSNTLVKNDKLSTEELSRRKKREEKHKKKYRHVRIIDDSSDENSKDETKPEKYTMNENVDKENISAVVSSEPQPKIINLSDEKSEDIDIGQQKDPDSADYEKEQDESSKNAEGNEKSEAEPKKPLIKCVNISKLLKPNVLQKTEGDPNKTLVVSMNTQRDIKVKEVNIRNKNKYRRENKIMEVVELADKHKMKNERREDEEEFWVRKRKEVKAFESKKFVINVIRLPTFTMDFLQTHNLKKITRNGDTICKITCDPKNKTETKTKDTLNIAEKADSLEPLFNDVKSVLLHSDSEESNDKNPSTNYLACETENVKNMLLDESESDTNDGTENNQHLKTVDNRTLEKTKELHTDESECNAKKEAEKYKNLKIAHLNDESNLDKSKNTELEKPGSDTIELTENNLNLKSVHTDESTNPVKSKNVLSDKSKSNTKCRAKNKCSKSLHAFDNNNLNKSDVKGTDDIQEQADTSKRESDLSENEIQLDVSNAQSDVLEKFNSEENTAETHAQIPKKCDKQPHRERTLSRENSDKVQKDNENTPLSKRKKSSESKTPQSKRKHIMESMHAKKMLLTYSSSSETEDEQLKNVLKEIKQSLLKEISSDEDNRLKKTVSRKILVSSDSSEDEGILKRVKKRRKIVMSSPKTKSCDIKEANEDSEAAKKNTDGNDLDDTHSEEKETAKIESETKKYNGTADSASSIDQMDGTMDEKSNSSSCKMGRSRQKPGSSSHNSDTQDDKDIDGLTNLKTLNKVHRRRDTSTDRSEDNTNKSKKIPKAPPLITGEGLLEAPMTSDDSSGAESEPGDEEDLPPVKLSGLNGDGIEHLAKDDLLVESDSDNSNEKDNTAEDSKKEDDSDTSENLKAKRRKANAISSDSEAGSSRRKAQVRTSDFEDSEAENSEPVKKKKKRKKDSDSDASGGSSNEGKKKRRRIRQMDSEGSGSDTENEGKKHGRKNIRKVMGKNQLEEATKKAARMEKERVARIAERQKKYNNLEFDESYKAEEVVLDKVVLDFDPDTKEPLIEVDRGLVKKLKPHQANGIKFMWNACFESVKRIKKDKGSGCILAHCMGLGKTLQVVSLTHTLLTHEQLTGVERVLVVCPLSTVLNWVNEYRMWLKYADSDYELDVYELSKYKQNSERAFQLSQWFKHGGVCVLGYEMFRNLSADNNKKFKKKMLKNFQEALVDPGPDLVICDEGHLLKNEKTSLSQSMNRVRTLRRIVLTGTPLQNNLKEYYCMVQFVKPNLLGKYNEYLNRFVNPITNGQYTDSTEHDIRIMKRRSHVLHKMLDGAVQRRDYGVLAPFLPPKHEFVLFITLTDIQIKLYQHYLDNYSRRPLPGKSSGFLFPDFQSMQRIWTHPLVLKYNSEKYDIMLQKKRDREEEDSEGSLVDFIDDDSTPDETSSDDSSDDVSDDSDDSRKKSKKKKSAKKGKSKDSKAAGSRSTRANPVELQEADPNPEILEVKNENPTCWWMQLVQDEELEDLRNSHKLVLLFEILRQCEAIGDKLLVFSQSLYSLDLIEHFLGKIDEATQDGKIDEKLGNHVGSWSPGIDYFRLDGSTSCENRSIWCKNFNKEDNLRARLFLISTRAGGLGINLTAANRVVIFDVSWNPSHDVQSIFRVYRFGQKKPCYVYRFLAMGTMEEKIYERQVTKQAISKRVIDEQQIDRHYAENDLAELYMFEPRPPAPRPVPLVPKKDMLFAELLKERDELIYKYHEHDSLLENKEEETLSEEERKAAWDDFENEKNRPPPAPMPTWPMHNGMVPGFLAQQQQQQMVYAALAQMLGKSMGSNFNEDQIRALLPQIYASNPGMLSGYDYGLMQKLNETFMQYPQSGMMNAAMMNPIMGAGSDGGMGGTSGLQYQPPWQRQQQQQQQMRLHQMMQQQNQMGAKLYAGGLGSRDPVAMALQQQRAKEIMLGDRGRPRGRPPMQPALPATAVAPGDVVNLDSD